MYQEGRLVGKKNIKRKVFDSKPQFFYLGTGAPKRSSDIKSYRGLIKDFCYWNTCLAGNEIQEIHNNYGINYLASQGQYSSADFLSIYYDMKNTTLDHEYDFTHGKVIDLANPTEPRSYAKTQNCIPRSEVEMENKRVVIPYRRQGSFELQRHKPQGYGGGKWKTDSTRLNQIRFYNQVISNETNLGTDGLSSLHFKQVDEKTRREYTHLKVTL